MIIIKILSKILLPTSTALYLVSSALMAMDPPQEQTHSVLAKPPAVTLPKEPSSDNSTLNASSSAPLPKNEPSKEDR